MLRKGISSFRLSLTIFGIDFFPSYDIVDPSSPTAQSLAKQIEANIEKETGWDRLKSIFRKDEYGNLSPELDGSLAAGAAGLLIGFFIGGLPASKNEYENFISRNKATSFESHFQAKDKLQFSVTRAMVQGGWKVGWRLGLFTGAYTFFTAAVASYRNQTTIFEYSTGGLLAGAMYKFPMGPKAMIAGGVGGAALGTMAGAISVGIMKLTGTTTEELRYWRHDWKEAKTRELITESPARAEATGALSLAHDNYLKQYKSDLSNNMIDKASNLTRDQKEGQQQVKS